MTPEEAIHTMLMKSWWIFLLPVFGALLKLFMPLIKGKIGEGVVNLAAKLRLDPDVYRLLKDVTIPSKRGTTQIDHIFVSVYGIFVVETKNYGGWIFADAKSPKWTQQIYKKKSRFQNPLHQNHAHLCALIDLLGIPKEKIHGAVCFMGDATFKTPIPDGVFLAGRFVNYIESFKAPVFSSEEVAELVRKIETGRFERGIKTDRAHVQQLRARHNPAPEKNHSVVNHSVNSSDPNCPACGAVMILRTAKRGANTGNQFWGCSTYPACRATKPFGG